MQSVLNGNLSEAHLENFKLRQLETMIKKKKMTGINVPYEKEKLRMKLMELQ